MPPSQQEAMMATIADFLVMQLAVLTALFFVYLLRDRREAAQVRRQEAASHTPPAPRGHALSLTAASA